MTKATTERLETIATWREQYGNGANVMIPAEEAELMARQLLAYEQAAKNPIGSFHISGGQVEATTDYCRDGEWPVQDGEVLVYAAPVLPKQPEHSRQHFESLCNQFWNWAELDEIDQDEEPRLEWNGSNYTHRVTAALWKMYQAAPTQPALVEKLKKIMNSWLAMEPKLAFQPEFTDVMMLLDAEPAPAQPVLPKWPSDEVERDALRYRFLRDSDFFGDQDEPGLVGWKELLELGYNELDAAIDARIAHPDIDYVKLDNALRKHIPAQPVSEPKAEGDFLSRLKAEHVELEDRCIKLSNFIQVNPAFKNLAPRMQRLLESQIAAMVEYDSILECRIDLIEDAAPAQEQK
ncbi:crAss001_48 related protein [Obesumbacterium proteus]|uniref:crAss001_48 related protein n=1 Tax=Obesumbacterium proteus TaxID=82983 RepID=UPI001F2C2EE5|nr:hypothetical protein [Obesumbacterium proteus]MCE9886219.1 hypothetical protein [Obesumbacterium proteus]MCE9914891.1 hypothetical protein [Obesumbacterium proteus]MCE9931616.1 hypothetical protein [Obesumbacterium proteus]MCG2876059.1 hypothetical protein [Obesumbacterium proteus]